MITIAIDGFSSTGKSTLAKQLATKLGYIFVDTGAMYRAITLFAIRNDIIGNDFFKIDELIEKLPLIKLDFKFNSTVGFAELYLNDVNVETEIRTMNVSNFVSKIAEISEVRSKLVEQQQQMGKNKGIVMDGRDIGTVVFPGAELKLFMTASPDVRAQRRFEELHLTDPSITFESVFENVQKRDYIDSHRTDSPLKMADDAIEIDNSFLSREEQFELVMELVADCTKSK